MILKPISSHKDFDGRQRAFVADRNKGWCGGFSLVELAIAVGVTSFCLLTLLALLPTGLRSADSASRQSTAINIGNGIFADLKTTAAYAAANSSGSLPLTTRYNLNIPTSTGPTPSGVQYALYLDNNGNDLDIHGNVLAASQAQFLAILTLLPQATSSTTPLAGLPKPAVLAQLLIAWPAAASANPPLVSPSATPTAHIYAPGTPSTDLRAQLVNYTGLVEVAGTVDLEQ
jgi:hypothetical protein